MKCMSCKTTEMVETNAAYFAQLNDCYIIIENVPCLKCEGCGETFYTTSVMEKIDAILEKVEKLASKIMIMDWRTAA